MDPSRGPKSLVFDAVFSEIDRLKEKGEVEDGEGVAIKNAKGKSRLCSLSNFGK